MAGYRPTSNPLDTRRSQSRDQHFREALRVRNEERDNLPKRLSFQQLLLLFVGIGLPYSLISGCIAWVTTGLWGKWLTYSSWHLTFNSLINTLGWSTAIAIAVLLIARQVGRSRPSWSTLRFGLVRAIVVHAIGGLLLAYLIASMCAIIVFGYGELSRLVTPQFPGQTFFWQPIPTFMIWVDKWFVSHPTGSLVCGMTAGLLIVLNGTWQHRSQQVQIVSLIGFVAQICIGVGAGLLRIGLWFGMASTGAVSLLLLVNQVTHVSVPGEPLGWVLLQWLTNWLIIGAIAGLVLAVAEWSLGAVVLVPESTQFSDLTNKGWIWLLYVLTDIAGGLFLGGFFGIAVSLGLSLLGKPIIGALIAALGLSAKGAAILLSFSIVIYAIPRITLLLGCLLSILFTLRRYHFALADDLYHSSLLASMYLWAFMVEASVCPLLPLAPSRKADVYGRVLDLLDYAPLIRPLTSTGARAAYHVNYAQYLIQSAGSLFGAAAITALEKSVMSSERAIALSGKVGRRRRHQVHALGLVNKSAALLLLAGRTTGTKGDAYLRRGLHACDEVQRFRHMLPRRFPYALVLANKAGALATLAGRHGGSELAEFELQVTQTLDEANALKLRQRERALLLFNRGGIQLNSALSTTGVVAIRYLNEAYRSFSAALAVCQVRIGRADAHSEAKRIAALAMVQEVVVLVRMAERRPKREARKLLTTAQTICDQMAGKVARTTILTCQGAILTAWAKMAKGSKAISLLTQAIEIYGTAAESYDQVTMGPQYATTQTTIGNLQQSLAQYVCGQLRVEALKFSIAAYDRALAVVDADAMGNLFTSLQVSKGVSLQKLGLTAVGESRNRSLTQAKACFERALSFYPVAVMPAAHRVVATHLIATIIALLQAPRDAADVDPSRRIQGASWGIDQEEAIESAWQIAKQGLRATHALQNRSAALEFRQAEWQQSARLYTLAATLQFLRKRPKAAIVLLELGRAHSLTEALHRRETDVMLLSDAERTQYMSEIDHIVDLEARGRAVLGSSEVVDLDAEAATAQGQLSTLVEALRQKYSAFLPRTTFDLSRIASELQEGEALIHLSPQLGGTLVLIMSGHLRVEGLYLPEIGEDFWHDVAQASIGEGNNVEDIDYLAAIDNGNLDAIRHALDGMLPILGDRLMQPVIRRLQDVRVKKATMIPGGILAVLPLHAAMYLPLKISDIPTAPQGRRYACDDLAITYAPSAELYRASSQAARQTTRLHSGLVIGNPQLTSAQQPWTIGMRGYLPFAELEARTVADIMSRARLSTVLKIGAEATWSEVVAGLGQAEVAWLAMHGTFEVEDPLSSALLVAPGAQLLLGDLLDPREVNLSRLRLVVLSACQSGISDYEQYKDEAVGLFAPFLASGVAGVIGTLWPVDDSYTAHLMTSLAKEVFLDRTPPAIALDQVMRRARADAGGAGSIQVFAEANLTSDIGGHGEEALVVSGSPSATAQPDRSAPPTTPVLRFLPTPEIEDPEASVHTEVAAPRTSAGTPPRSSADIPPDHPVYWAAFVYYGP